MKTAKELESIIEESFIEGMNAQKLINELPTPRVRLRKLKDKLTQSTQPTEGKELKDISEVDAEQFKKLFGYAPERAIKFLSERYILPCATTQPTEKAVNWDAMIEKYMKDCKEKKFDWSDTVVLVSWLKEYYSLLPIQHTKTEKAVECTCFGDGCKGCNVYDGNYSNLSTPTEQSEAVYNQNTLIGYMSKFLEEAGATIDEDDAFQLIVKYEEIFKQRCFLESENVNVYTSYEKREGKFSPYFKIGNQTFNLSNQDTEDEAKWVVEMMDIAFSKRKAVKDIADVSGRSEHFYCADWNRCGATCEEQCSKCKKAEDMPQVAQ